SPGGLKCGCSETGLPSHSCSGCPPVPSPLPGPSSGPAMNPSSDIDMYRTDFATRSPSSGADRARSSRLNACGRPRPCSSRSSSDGKPHWTIVIKVAPSRGVNVNSVLKASPRPVEAGLGRGQQQAAGALDRLEHVPVPVQLARRRAEGDLPGAADAQRAARVDWIRRRARSVCDDALVSVADHQTL